MKRLAGAAGGVAVAIGVLVSAPARAQQPAPASAGAVATDREAQRTELYRQAVEMANGGRWAEAAEKLRAVLAIRSSPKVLFTLGQAEEHVGRLSAAYDDYAQALADAEAASETDVATTAGAALHSLGPRVPVVRVMVTGEAAGAATATVDDRAAPVGQTVRVDPGPHRISVVAPGVRTVASTVTVAEGQKLDVPVRLEREGAAAPTAPTAPADSADAEAPAPSGGSFPWRTVGLVTAGVGVVGLGIGTYFGIDAISKNNASNSSGCSGNTCTSSAYTTRENARSSATVSNVAFVVGGLLAAGGVTLWLLAPPTADAAVQVAPTALAGGGGVIVAGAWR